MSRPNPSPEPPSIASRAISNTVTLLVARVVSRLIALVTVFATANSLLPAGNGVFQTTITYTALSSVLVDLGFNTLYTREAARSPEDLPRYLRIVLSTRAIFALPALAALAIAMWISGFQSLLLPAFALMLTGAYANVLRSTFYALGRLQYESAAIVAESVLLLGGTLTGVVTHQGIAFFLWVYTAQYCFSCSYFVAVISRRGIARLGWEFDLQFLLSWFRKSLPFALAFVITTLYVRINQPILLYFHGPEQVGWFAFAYKPVEALLFVPMTVMNVAFPILSIYHQESPERLVKAISRFYKALLALGWPISVGTVILAAGINRLFDRSGQFEPAATALGVLGAGIVIMFVTNAFIAALNAIDRQVLFSWAAVVSLAVNAAVNLALIPAHGFVGAAWATNLTELALLVTVWLMVRRLLGPIPLLRLSWRILLAGAVMGTVLLLLFRSAHGWLVLAAIPIGAIVYGGLLLLLRAFEPDELALARQFLLRRR